MNDQIARVLVVLAVTGVAVLIAVVSRRLQRPVHPDITVGDIGDRPGVILFTSTDCGNCKEAIAVLRAEDVPFREVTHELEPQRFESWMVMAVPLTVVLDMAGDVVGLMAGVPRRRSLKNAVRSAGIVQT